MDKETNIQNTDSAEKNIQPLASGQQEEPVFYNVMPKAKSEGAMVEPTMEIKITEESLKPARSGTMDFFSKYRLFWILGLAVTILGFGIYYGMNKYFSGQADSDVIINNISAIKHDQPADSGSNADFTTPREWREKYFPGCSEAAACGDSADPDRDGLANLEEQNLGTDPNNNDSDQDGLADGDEAKVFASNPLNAHTSGNQKFNDADYIKGGYGFIDDKPLSAEQIKAFTDKMAQFDLHVPTLATIGNALNAIYHFSGTNATSSPSALAPAGNLQASSTDPLAGFDQSLEAKQDRDVQRSNTIKNIGIALILYKEDVGGYPNDGSFQAMFDKIKPYLKVAARAQDPINIDPFIYSYALNAKGDDFTLSFYSEIAGQVIRKHAADAAKDKIADTAAIYDNQRKMDLESLRTALLLYSSKNAAGNQNYVFPKADKYKIDLVPEFIGSIPKDPKTAKDYEYQVSDTFATFTLKAVLDNPSAGTTGYLCNQEECREY